MRQIKNLKRLLLLLFCPLSRRVVEVKNRGTKPGHFESQYFSIFVKSAIGSTIEMNTKMRTDLMGFTVGFNCPLHPKPDFHRFMNTCLEKRTSYWGRVGFVCGSCCFCLALSRLMAIQNRTCLWGRRSAWLRPSHRPPIQ